MDFLHSLRNMSPAMWALPVALLAAGCGDKEPIDPTTSTTTGSGGSGGTGTGGTTSSGGSGGSGTGGTTGTGETGGTTGTGGTGGSGGAAQAPDLDPTFMWYGDNRQRLDAMIDARGVHAPDYDAANKPVAVFDWDNTVIKNDVGDATMFWALRHDKILQPPGKKWALTSPYLTPAAITALDTACGSLAAPGAPLPTSTDAACADAIVNVYYNEKINNADAFSGFDYRTIEAGYAWAAQLFAGYTPAEVGAIADAAITENLDAAEGAQQTVGTVAGLNGYVRLYDQMANLIDTLQKNGFDVWVVSASPQYVVEPFAAKVNVAADHVVGIRQVLDQGKLTYNLQGCGPVPDGTNDGAGTFTGNSLITYIEGKRCWINKAIFGNTGATAIDKQADPAKRQVFSAGDSNTDVSFVQDATAMKLVLNRNKTELMCNAYRDYGGIWLINPMFIKPKGQYAAGYPCSTTGCVSADGVKGPCLDEAGMTIPDQADNVY
jgi:phosphoglycolate phosphatase-like HAD superfamily hydrolase